VSAPPLTLAALAEAASADPQAVSPAALAAAVAATPRAELRAAAAGAVPNAAAAVPDEHGRDSASGPVAAGTAVHVADGADGWRLTVDGTSMSRAPSYGWASGFTITKAGTATLSYRTSPLRLLLVAGQTTLWVLAVVVVLRARRRRVRREAEAGEPA
jgi:hypothetical protein